MRRASRWLRLVEGGSSFEAAALRVYGEREQRPSAARRALLADLRDVIDHA